MITYTRGDLFESSAQTLVNSVNCVGVMGKGIAKTFRDRFPEMFREYKNACARGEMRSGVLYLYRDLRTNVLCFPTKDNWKGPSKYEFIEAGLETLRANYERWGITSLAIPPLGCGLGGLDWQEVRELIERHLGDLPIPIEVYEPFDDPAARPHARKQPTRARVNVTVPLAVVGELIRTARATMLPSVPLGRLLVQKLAFFAQVAGAPVKLSFTKYKFGPYDHRVNHMIDRLEGLYVRDDSSSWARSQLRMLDEEAWLRSLEPLSDELSALRHYIDSAVALLHGHSLDEAELLSTVQYAWCADVASGGAGRLEDICDFVATWSEEKRLRFPEEHVERALCLLDDAGWLGPKGPGDTSPLCQPEPETGVEMLA